MTARPVSPGEVEARKVACLPDGVIEAFNELIVERFSEGTAVVGQDAAVSRIVEKLGVERQAVFERGWLEIEGVYRKAGWHVLYDKPGYNETYPATYTFSRKPR